MIKEDVKGIVGKYFSIDTCVWDFTDDSIFYNAHSNDLFISFGYSFGWRTWYGVVKRGNEVIADLESYTDLDKLFSDLKKQTAMREFFFYSDHNLSNRVTVCGIYENGSLRFSAARTSDNDKFVRKIGRAKARGRAVSHPIVTVGAVQEETLIKTFNEHAKRIANIVRITPAFNEKEYLFT